LRLGLSAPLRYNPDQESHPLRRKFVIAFTLAVVLLLGLLAVLVMLPNRPPGDASAVFATLVGYTNNPVGKRVAVFNINNRNPVAIRRLWYYEVQVLTGSKWTPQPTVRLPYAHGPVIPPNQSEIWTINAPTADARWRVWFPYEENRTRFREMKETVRRKLRAFGLRFKSHEVTYTGLTPEVEPPGRE
jgi:hypothetical protein